MKMNHSIFLLILSFQFFQSVLCKECTNIPTQLASHTLRYILETSGNQTWKEEIFAYYNISTTPAANAAAAAAVVSHSSDRRILRRKHRARKKTRVHKLVKNSGGVKGKLSEVSLHDVRLDPDSMHGKAQQTNLNYLLMLDVDALLWSFRKTAGLKTPGKPYGGWESPNIELRGHFVGHYMSATAHMWASTHNETLKEKMTAVVSALSACQKKIGNGYLSAFPTDLFDHLEARQPAWAPYYTIHKILAGLLDQYTLAGNSEALNMTIWMVDYFNNRVQNVISKYTITRHWQTLNDESGGMNDVLYRLYTITGDQKHLLLAHLFDKPCFLGLLALKEDDLSGFHANTHIPVVVGLQARYELTKDPLYKEMGLFFMNIVNSSHSYATGGTSDSEFWTDPNRLADTLNTENEESCATYNILKVSRHLFRWTMQASYADYYERALTNGVLSIQRGNEPGVMIYMLPLGRGVSKGNSFHGWGKPFDSFWCCYGTGIESFSKLGDSIYFEAVGQVPALYIIQYTSSSFNWSSGKLLLNQKVEPVVSWDPTLRVTLNFTTTVASNKKSTLNLRIPLWTGSDGAKASLNGRNLELVSPGNFLSVSEEWRTGDSLTIELPIRFRTEAIKDERPAYASLKAILYGPYLLAGLSDGDWDIHATSNASFSDWISPVPSYYNSHLITLSQGSAQSTLALMTTSNNTLKMDIFPQPGTNVSVSATFRIIIRDPAGQNISQPRDAVGKSVMLEPFNLPGIVVVESGDGQSLGVSPVALGGKASVFNMIAGLDGGKDTVSLESEEKRGCYVVSNGSNAAVLGCKSGSAAFKKSASFSLEKGVSEYHPISFVGKGKNRNFLLLPLLSLRDEFYTVYFNFTA